MQVAFAGLVWVALLLAGGTGALSNVGAPLPLDPALSAIAPPECLWYGATSGVGPADASSSNHTEQLFAEPAIQKFLTSIESQLLAALDKARAQAPPDEQVAMQHVPAILKALNVANRTEAVIAAGALGLGGGKPRAD